MDTAEKMEESSKNEGEKNEITQRFSKTYLSKVDISDETKNDSAPLKLKIEELVKQLQSKYDETKINAVVEIRRMLSANLSDQRKPPIDEIIENGIVPILIEDLKVSNEILRFEILWILTNIASGTFEQTKVIIDSGAVPLFLHFLHSTDHNIADQAAWLFGNIIADKTQFYNYCIEFGFIEEILKFDFEKLRIKNLQTITWIMANLCRNKELCPEKNIGKLFSPILELLVYNSDTGILDQTLLTITFLTDPNDQQRITLKDTVVKRLVELLNHRRLHIQSSSLTILTYITFNNVDQIKLLLDYGILPQICQFLIHPKTSINKQACLFLSSLINGKDHRIQEIFDANLVESLIKLLSQNDFRKFEESLSVISKIVEWGDPKHIQCLIKNDIILSFSSSMIAETTNTETLIIILKCIKNILEKCETYFPIVIQQLNDNGMIKDNFEKLETRKNSDLSNLVKEIKDIFLAV